jgi:HlyD family secretion protein
MSVTTAAGQPSTKDEPSLALGLGSRDRGQRERRRARIRLLRQGVWAALIGGAALLLALSLRPQPVPVDVASVERGPLSVVIEESGKTRVKDRYIVSAMSTGRLSRVWLEPGDVVREGDKLAKISPSLAPLIDERARAEAEARLGAALSSVGQARTRLARAVTAQEQAERDRGRARTLVASGALSAQVLEDAEFTLRMRADEVASSQFAVKVADEEARLARAALVPDRGNGSDRHIDVLAPASGRVLRVLHESAGLVGAGTPLLEVGDPSALEAVVDLLTTDAVQVHPGTPAVIVGWGGESAINARVTRVEPAGVTRLSALGVEEQRVDVILSLTDPPDTWSSLGDGYHIEARLELWRSESVVKVPVLAVFRHGGGSAAFKLDGGTVQLTPITLGHRGALEVEVLSGLAPGDVVVVHPGDRVKDGVKVAVNP